jgi:hypothetical protein
VAHPTSPAPWRNIITGNFFVGLVVYDAGNLILYGTLTPLVYKKYALNEEASHVEEPVLIPLVGVLTHFCNPARLVSGR